MKKIIFIFLYFFCIDVIAYSVADTPLISIFPLTHYDQTISHWIKANDANYDKALLTKLRQQQHLRLFYQHIYGNLSPWSPDYIRHILKQRFPDNLKNIEQDIIAGYDNQRKPADQIGYSENFRPYSAHWIARITDHINLNQFDHLTYQAKNRAIAVENLFARMLPTTDVYFFNYQQAGKGYPFDNMQASALWAGTPVYILAMTRDRVWSLVTTPDYIAWVKSAGLARVTPSFIKTWQTAAKKRLAAITHTQTALFNQHHKLLLTAYVGSLFPVAPSHRKQGLQLMIPIADSNQTAVIQRIPVDANLVALIPLSATPHHFAALMQTLIGRPYGWGNMYFYNDCSAELKNLFTPFGIWLPRHSADQATRGKMVDMTAAPQQQRLSFLMQHGHPFLTLVYVGGHVVMYLGNYPNPNAPDHALMAMTYQDVWGLSPNPPTRRAVIGKSVIFPLLIQYPEDKTLVSIADRKYFKVSFLDELPDHLLKQERMSLQDLMHP